MESDDTGWLSDAICSFAPRPSGSHRLRGDFHVIDGRVWFGNLLAHFTQSLEVGSQGILKVPARVFLRVADGDTSGNVWRIGGVACTCLLNDHGIASGAHFSPAFLSIAFSVPGASSLPSLPGTVITNAWVGCLKCRWLPMGIRPI